MRRVEILVCAALLSAGCPDKRKTSPRPERPQPVVLTVVGTNDLHGHIERLPTLAGYVDILRRKGNGGVVLVDAGDMFQGTLASNLGEGAAVIEAYDALGYHAAAIGNHEFDFGPVGERATPGEPGEDPRGALKARATEASFPLLTANLMREEGGRVQWEGAPASVLLRVGAVAVGILGVTSAQTLETTLAANVEDLEIAPLADVVEAEAERLRSHGATVVIALAHAGGRCTDFDDPRDLSSCDTDREIFQVVRELEPGTVDVVVAGHTHAGVAHFVNGIPVVEAYAKGAAFSRVDLTVVPGVGVEKARIHPPRFLCKEKPPPCETGLYEGAPVSPSSEVQRAIDPHLEAARAERERSLGVEVEREVERSYGEESALGNLFADLMQRARPEADVALTNGGGLRADLPAGDLTYGELYRAMPFDNRFAAVRLDGAQLRRLIARNLRSEGGIFSLSGLRARARCRGEELEVELTREGAGRIAEDEEVVLVTSDFLATGGDGAIAGLDLPEGAIEIDDGPPIRDAIAGVLSRERGALSGDDRELYDPDNPRLDYPGERPVSCP